MNNEIPLDHPRRLSLLTREKIVSGWKNGLVAQVGLIAHGRGEAFDYLIGEKTSKSSLKAIKYAALLLLTAKKPVISVNGNTAVLVRDNLINLSTALYEKRGDQVPIEVNLFYRTPERMSKLLNFLKNTSKSNIKILGAKADARIPGLSSERAKCEKDGIFSADVIFVPLEDGDRCEALIKMGKTVIAVDLNPFSRTSRTASVTIVDNITRIIPELIKEILSINENKNILNQKLENSLFNNKTNLKDAIEELLYFINKFSLDPII
ncbi:MAG: 4-phosphopantoate--beta-alanine ligase [Candidatus Heimdallarchaeota archaeon LC_3]|nr:MAG: 4-phosphopantoate--beta-alanine ligase [Candidatus Heimdallarchaeota archaeon LC_3]